MSNFRLLLPKNNSFKKGLSLMEIIVAVSLSVIIIITLYTVYNSSYQVYRNNSSKAELNQNARIALERISRDLRQTYDIVTVLPPTNTDPLNPPPSTLEFIDGHNTTKTQYVKYVFANGQLRRQVVHYYFSSDVADWVSAGAKDQYNNPPLSSIDEDTIKADKVTSLEFFGTDVINIIITTEDKGQNQTYQTQVLGRNI